MLSFRAHQVNLRKGDLPGHPFRGNQCVDEDWQPQPGDPCGSDGDGGEGLTLTPVTGEVTGEWMFDDDVRRERLKYLEEETGGGYASAFIDEVRRVEEREDFNDMLASQEIEMISPVVVELQPDRPTSEIEGVVQWNDERIAEHMWYNDTSTMVNEAAGTTDSYEEFVERIDLSFASTEGKEHNANMWSLVKPLDKDVTLYRGTSLDESSEYSGREHLDFDAYDEVVGQVREPSYFMPTSTDPKQAALFAGDQDVTFFGQTAEEMMDDLSYGSAAHKLQRMMMAVEGMVAGSASPIEETSYGHMSVINVPAGAPVIPIYVDEMGLAENEVVLAPGYQMVSREIVDWPVIDGKLYRSLHVYDYVPVEGVHYTDPRGRS